MRSKQDFFSLVFLLFIFCISGEMAPGSVVFAREIVLSFMFAVVVVVRFIFSRIRASAFGTKTIVHMASFGLYQHLFGTGIF